MQKEDDMSIWLVLLLVTIGIGIGVFATGAYFVYKFADVFR